jgi:hypothetical protein
LCVAIHTRAGKCCDVRSCARNPFDCATGQSSRWAAARSIDGTGVTSDRRQDKPRVAGPVLSRLASRRAVGSERTRRHVLSWRDSPARLSEARWCVWDCTSPRLVFPVQSIHGEVDFPYRKKNSRSAGDQPDVHSLDVGARSPSGCRSLDRKTEGAAVPPRSHPPPGRARTEGKKLSSPLTAAERETRDEERQAAKRAEARAAMADQAARATAFNDNRERLRAARLAREAKGE